MRSVAIVAAQKYFTRARRLAKAFMDVVLAAITFIHSSNLTRSITIVVELKSTINRIAFVCRIVLALSTSLNIITYYMYNLQCNYRNFVHSSVRKRSVRSGLGSKAAGLGFFHRRPGWTVGFSPTFRAYLARPGRTADICRISSDKM